MKMRRLQYHRVVFTQLRRIFKCKINETRAWSRSRLGSRRRQSLSQIVVNCAFNVNECVASFDCNRCANINKCNGIHEIYDTNKKKINGPCSDENAADWIQENGLWGEERMKGRDTLWFIIIKDKKKKRKKKTIWWYCGERCAALVLPAPVLSIPYRTAIDPFIVQKCCIIILLKSYVCASIVYFKFVSFVFFSLSLHIF